MVSLPHVLACERAGDVCRAQVAAVHKPTFKWLFLLGQRLRAVLESHKRAVMPMRAKPHAASSSSTWRHACTESLIIVILFDNSSQINHLRQHDGNMAAQLAHAFCTLGGA